MVTLESSRNLGGIGAILLFVGAAGILVEPFLGFVAVLGVVLGVVALHGLADHFAEKRIFSNGLWAFIALVVGVVVAFAALFYLLVYTDIFSQFAHIIYPAWNGDWATLPSAQAASPESIDVAALVPLLTHIYEVYAVFCVFLVASGFFVWRSLRQVQGKSGINLFGTSGILLFIGGILSFVFIGVILMWIAILMLAIAFFQLKPQPQPIPPAPATTPPTAPQPQTTPV